MSNESCAASPLPTSCPDEIPRLPEIPKRVIKLVGFAMRTVFIKFFLSGTIQQSRKACATY